MDITQSTGVPVHENTAVWRIVKIDIGAVTITVS